MMTRPFRYSMALVLVGVLLTAAPLLRADDQPAKDANTTKKALDPSVGGVANAKGGSITGTIYFQGLRRPQRIIDSSATAYCQSAHPNKPLLDPTWKFGKTFSPKKAALQNVMIYVSKGIDDKDYKAPSKHALMGQENCMYVPHILGVVAGQTLTVTNDDNTLHNVNLTSKHNGTHNEGEPIQGMEVNLPLKHPEMGITITCDVHPWMRAYVNVMSNPFFAVTQEAGTYTLKGLPAGEYEISVWHEFPRFAPINRTQAVTVKVGQTVKDVDFTFTPAKPPKGK